MDPRLTGLDLKTSLSALLDLVLPRVCLVCGRPLLPQEVRDAWVKTIPLRRGGTVDEVAKVALFLASDLSSYVSGQVINCCGAMNC